MMHSMEFKGNIIWSSKNVRDDDDDNNNVSEI